MVLVAGRNAAGRHDQVMRLRGTLQRLPQLHRIVAQDAEIGDPPAHLPDQRRQDEPVGVVDGAGGQGRSRLHQLIAGGDDGDPQRGANIQPGRSDRRSQADILRTQPASGGQDHGIGADILPSLPKIGAALDARPDQHASQHARPRLLAAILLHHDGVETGRNRRSGEDADGRSLRVGQPRPVTRRDPGDDGQDRIAVAGQILEPDGIAVHRRVVVRRHADRRHHIRPPAHAPAHRPEPPARRR